MVVRQQVQLQVAGKDSTSQEVEALQLLRRTAFHPHPRLLCCPATRDVLSSTSRSEGDHERTPSLSCGC